MLAKLTFKNGDTYIGFINRNSVITGLGQITRGNGTRVGGMFEQTIADSLKSSSHVLVDSDASASRCDDYLYKFTTSRGCTGALVADFANGGRRLVVAGETIIDIGKNGQGLEYVRERLRGSWSESIIRLTWSDGDTYVGQAKQDNWTRSTVGEITKPDGTRMQGLWVDGKLSDGLIFDANGKQIQQLGAGTAYDMSLYRP